MGNSLKPLLFLIMVFAATTQAMAKDRIVWVVNDLIPFYIHDGPFRDQGISDKLIRFFEGRLTEYEHVEQSATFSRFYDLAKKGDLVCNPLLLKTSEREKILSYSIAYKPAYAHVLVGRHEFDEVKGSTVSLTKFLLKDEHKIYVQKNRSYGPVLDKIIASAKTKGRIEEEDLTTKQLLLMLDSGRIDHFLDIENTATYFKTIGERKHRLQEVAIAEDRLDRFGYAVCSKTSAGQKVISRLNTIIQQEAESLEFREILESWMAESNKARFREFYEREILANLN